MCVFYGKVCSVQAGRISADDVRMSEEPARGSTVLVRALAARQAAEGEVMPAECGISLTREGAGENVVIWRLPAPEPVEEVEVKVSKGAEGGGEGGGGGVPVLLKTPSVWGGKDLDVDVDVDDDGGASPGRKEGVEIERASSTKRDLISLQKRPTNTLERASSNPPPPKPRPPTKEHRMFLPFGSYSLDAMCESKET